MKSKIFRFLLRSTGPKSIFHRALTQVIPPSLIAFDGCTMLVNPRNNYTEYRLFLDQVPYENQTYKTLISLAQRKTLLFYDIGANCGVYAIPIAQTAGANSRILAFEPNPVLLDRLRHNIALNHLENVTVYPVALGSTEGQMSLQFKSGRREDYGRASLAVNQANSRSIPVDVRVLADFVPDATSVFEAIILKIDVEGYEDRVLIPFFEKADRAAYPNYIALEISHEDLWISDLRQRLKDVGYHELLTCDGNAILELLNE